MGLNNLKPAEGAIHNSVQRGRGYGCGLGKTSGRGQKGQGARAGGCHNLGHHHNFDHKQHGLQVPNHCFH